MFAKVVIATRGECALRIARSCERMGIATIAIHAQGEADAPHVTACREALALPDTAAAGAYRDVAGILAGAKALGADALHPGDSALGCDPAFAEAVHAAGLAFVGAAPEALQRFAEMEQGRAIAESAGANVLATRRVGASRGNDALDVAAEMGYPLSVVRSDGSSAGAADASDELLELMESARRDGETTVLLVRFVERPRLLAVHVAVDAHGAGAALCEVEHSVELDGQELLVETPAPAISGLPSGRLKRETLCSTAVAVAIEGGLSGLASVEFVLDHTAAIHFVGLRAGLPEAHALSEAVGAGDLVELGLRIAAGEPLPESVRLLHPSGHAIEARMFQRTLGEQAADPVLAAVQWPVMPKGALRVEAALEIGKPVTHEPGSPLARVIAHGTTRHQAILTLDRALAEHVLEPLSTNAALLRQILGDESYRAGQFDRGFVERLPSPPQPAPATTTPPS